mmetsp:Transcript_28811/g.45384  ORF Transcript_28811/g.45384 Transcript_28811/m.45384 type:complete len:221 (+) Transcript_28811:1-663(+)
MESILCSMAVEYDPERPLPPPSAATNRQVALPSNLPFWPGVFPTTGSSPKRARRSYYGDANNSHKYHYQRGNRCIGIVQLICDASGKLVKNKTCAQCNRGGATWYCGVCHLYFHNKTPSDKVRSGQPIPMMAASTGRMKEDGTPEVVYARMTCADIWHNAARQQFFSPDAFMCKPIPSSSVISFDQNVHNRAYNLSFADSTDMATLSGGDTTDADDNSTP